MERILHKNVYSSSNQSTRNLKTCKVYIYHNCTYIYIYIVYILFFQNLLVLLETSMKFTRKKVCHTGFYIYFKSFLVNTVINVTVNQMTWNLVGMHIQQSPRTLTIGMIPSVYKKIEAKCMLEYLLLLPAGKHSLTCHMHQHYDE